MENMSKALLIAGGMLLAMIIVGLIIILSNSINSIGQADAEKQKAEEIVEFNKQYEPYNKKIMYGTDVITVINKAIENNKKVAENIHSYFIEIELTTTQNFATTIVEATVNLDGSVTKGEPSRVENISLTQGTYRLKKGEQATKQELERFFGQPVNDTSVKEGRKVIYTYSALTDFKRSTYSCTSMGIDNETGRINKIVIKQTNSAVY